MESKKKYIPTQRYFAKKSGEVLILTSSECINKGSCVFCTFHLDNVQKIDKDVIKRNIKIVDQLTGYNGILRVYSSSSIFDLDASTLNYLIQKIHQLNYNYVFCESHWGYRGKFEDFKEQVKSKYIVDLELVVRTGVETFDNSSRSKVMNKHLGVLEPEQIRKYTNGINLISGIKGQSFQQFLSDLYIGMRYFDYIWFSIADPNYMCVRYVDFELRQEIIEYVKANKYSLNWDYQPDLGGENPPDIGQNGLLPKPLVMVYPSVRGKSISPQKNYCDYECENCYRNPLGREEVVNEGTMV